MGSIPGPETSTCLGQGQKATNFFFFFVFLAISWATPMAYGGSQAKGRIGAVVARPTPEPQQRGIRAASATYTTAHGNAGSLTHQAKAGTEPATSWFLVGFVNHCTTTGTPYQIFKYDKLYYKI